MLLNANKYFFLLFVLGVSTSVFSQTDNLARAHIENIVHAKTKIDPANIAVCSEYGCKKITQVSIDQKLQSRILQLFQVDKLSAQYERALLAEYIAHVEQFVGRQTNTQFDRAGSFPVFLKLGEQYSSQMDCIDESINTLSYLRLLDSQGMITHHDVTGLVTRGGLLAGYPHTAVLLTEKQSNKKYVIDSWFYDNGRPAVVLPLKIWKRGWKPSD